MHCNWAMYERYKWEIADMEDFVPTNTAVQSDARIGFVISDGKKKGSYIHCENGGMLIKR